MQVKLLLFTFTWMVDCMEFLSENHLVGSLHIPID